MSERLRVHDTAVKFRASAVFVRAVAEHARKEGMSLSEFLRLAARREMAGDR